MNEGQQAGIQRQRPSILAAGGSVHRVFVGSCLAPQCAFDQAGHNAFCFRPGIHTVQRGAAHVACIVIVSCVSFVRRLHGLGMCVFSGSLGVIAQNP